MNRVIGKCSECGGQVTLPELWYGINPPVPTCQKCGATADLPDLPVIPMKPRRTKQVELFYKYKSENKYVVPANGQYYPPVNLNPYKAPVMPRLAWQIDKVK